LDFPSYRAEDCYLVEWQMTCVSVSHSPTLIKGLTDFFMAARLLLEALTSLT